MGHAEVIFPTDDIRARYEAFVRAHAAVRRIVAEQLPAGDGAADALRLATGRETLTDAQRAELEELGPRGEMLPLSFG